MKGVKWGDNAVRRTMAESNWKNPASWERKAARTGQEWRVFSGSLCDILDSHAPDGQRDRLFETIKQTPHLSWLLLTKRESNFHLLPQPLPQNVWIGVTAGNQEYFDKRVSALRNVNATVRFVSYEPALRPLNLDTVEPGTIHWVICACESGSERRPMKIQWARDVRDQCRALGIAFFMKQMEIDDEIKVGDAASFTKTITESDIHSFSAITADFNPIHVDEVYAKTSSLGQKTCAG